MIFSGPPLLLAFNLTTVKSLEKKLFNGSIFIPFWISIHVFGVFEILQVFLWSLLIPWFLLCRPAVLVWEQYQTLLNLRENRQSPLTMTQVRLYHFRQLVAGFKIAPLQGPGSDLRFPPEPYFGFLSCTSHKIKILNEVCLSLVHRHPQATDSLTIESACP